MAEGDVVDVAAYDTYLACASRLEISCVGDILETHPNNF
jgi:hypothetical protein